MEIFNDLHTDTKYGLAFIAIIMISFIYIIVKNSKTIDLQLKLIILVTIVLSIYLAYASVEEEQKIKSLVNNFELTTGKVMEHIYIEGRGRTITSSSIKYSYFVNDSVFINKYSSSYFIKVPTNKPDLNSEYLVIFDKGDPKYSFILLNYELKDKNDLEKYKAEFRIKIPDNTFKH